MPDDNPFSAIKTQTDAVTAGTGNPFSMLKDAATTDTAPVEPPATGMREGNPAFSINAPPKQPLPNSPDTAEALKRAEQDQQTLNDYISNTLAKGGNKFDPSSGDDPLMFRAGIAKHMEQGGLPAAQLFLSRQNPEGSVISVDTPSGPLTLYRKTGNQDEPYKPLGTAAEFAGANINFKNAGIMAAAAFTGGLGASGAALVGGVAGATGNELDLQREKMRGYARNVSGADESLRDVGAFAEGSVGNALPAVLKSFRLPNFGALMKVDPTAAALVDKVTQEGLWPLSVGQMSDSPLVRTAVRQSSATNPILERLTLDQKQSLQGSIEKQIQLGGYDGVSQESLQLLSALQRNQALTVAGATGDSVQKSDLNKFVQTALQNFKDSSGVVDTTNRQAAAEAFKGEQAWFNISPLQAAAKRIDRGIVGKPLDGAEPGTGIQILGPTREIQPFVDTIKSLDPQVQNFAFQGRTDDAFTQLMSVRDQLRQLVDNGSSDATRAQAGQLYDATQQVIGNAKGASATTKYLSQKAIDFQDQRNTTLSYFQKVLSDNEPGNVATKLIKPGFYDTAAEVVNSLSDDELKTFKNGFKGDLVASPNTIESRIAAFNNDKKTLGLMLSPDEQNAMVAYGNIMKRFDQTVAGQAVKSGASSVENALNLAKNGSYDELNKLVSTAGGYDSSTATAVRSGIYRDILDRAKTTDSLGRSVVDAKAVQGATQEYINQADGRLQGILGPADIKRLQTWNQYAGVLGAPAGDTQASLARGAMVSFLKKPLEVVMEPERTAFYLYSLVNNKFWGEVLARPASGAVIDSIHGDTITAATIKKLMSAGALATQDIIRKPGNDQGPVMPQ